MAKPPFIRIPGLTARPGVQGGSRGVVVGRMTGRGPLQLLGPTQQQQLGIRARSNNQIANEAGFTFSVTGIPSSNLFVGQGSWSKNLSFQSDDPNNSVVALIPATGTPSFRILNSSLVELGTIQFTATTKGIVTWLANPYIHPAGALMLLYCPDPADATLGNVSGRVAGYI